MFNTILQLFILIFAGIIWRLLEPGSISATNIRAALANMVYYMLLPALSLQVLWTASWQWDLLLISLLAVCGVITGATLMYFASKFISLPANKTGALLLAAAFPNVTYMGLPVLESMFGPWARVVVVHYDLFATTPMLFSLGMLIGVKYGVPSGNNGIWHNISRLPYLWTALLGLVLNYSGIIPPVVIASLLEQLTAMIAPLMLFAVGLAMRVKSFTLANVVTTTPVVIIQLLLMPFVIYLLTIVFDSSGKWQQAITLEAAMPVMLLGLVICDRFKLDSGLYAIAATVSTLLSLITLPLWQVFLGAQ